MLIKQCNIQDGVATVKASPPPSIPHSSPKGKYTSHQVRTGGGRGMGRRGDRHSIDNIFFLYFLLKTNHLYLRTF